VGFGWVLGFCCVFVGLWVWGVGREEEGVEEEWRVEEGEEGRGGKEQMLWL